MDPKHIRELIQIAKQQARLSGNKEHMALAVTCESLLTAVTTLEIEVTKLKQNLHNASLTKV